MFKKILFSVIAFLLLFQSTVAPVFAQSPWYDQSIYPWYTKVYDINTSPSNEIFGERYTAAQTQWVIYSLIVVPLNMMFGSEFTACVLNYTENSIKDCFSRNNTIPQMLAKVANIIADSGVNRPHNLAFVSMIFQDRPLSGITYTKNFLRRATSVPEVHAAPAAGFGFGALSVLQEAWKKSRDISYGLLIFAAIIMSFMIMLRTKISPQTVITVQSAIPQLVFAIILITFSFAIAGFMIDLMYVSIGLISTIMAKNPAGVANIYSFLTDGPGGSGLLGVMFVYAVVFPIFLMVAVFSGGGGVGLNIVGAIMQNNVLLFVTVLIGFVIVGILLVFAFLRAIFMLIRTLVSIYLLVIFGPFYILGGTLTQSLGFGSWIKELTSNLLVFPAVGIMFLYAVQFLKWGIDAYASGMPSVIRIPLNAIFNSLIGQELISSPVSGWSPPLLGFGGGGLMLIFVSLAVILLIPKIADIIKGFMSGRPFAYGSGIGEAFSAPIAAGGAAVGGYRSLRDLYNKRYSGAVGGNKAPQK